MINKQNRLRKRSDFEKLWKKSSVIHGKNISLRFMPNNLDSLRVGVVISTKVSKSSVKRNLSKRRIREAIRKEWLPSIKKGFDLAIIGKNTVITTTYKEIASEVGYLLNKANLI